MDETPRSKCVLAQLLALICNLDEMKNNFLVNCKTNFSRLRTISFRDVILFLLQLGGSGTQEELIYYYTDYGTPPTKSAFFQQRIKVLPSALSTLFLAFSLFLVRFLPTKTAFGYRILAVDGTSLSVMYNANDLSTYQPNGDKKGFNRLHLTTIHDTLNNIYIDAILQPGGKRNERAAFVEMLDRYDSPTPSIFLFDRGFESYNLIAYLLDSEVKFILRVKEDDSNGIFSNPKLDLSGDTYDRQVTTILTRNQSEVYRKDKAYTVLGSSINFDFLTYDVQFYTLSFRVVRFLLPSGEYECIATNLPQDEFPVEVISALYNARWHCEVSYLRLKERLDLEAFHSRIRQCVEQEVWAKLVMFNYTSAIVDQFETSLDYTEKILKANRPEEDDQQQDEGEEDTQTSTPSDESVKDDNNSNEAAPAKKSGDKKPKILKYDYKINYAVATTVCFLYFEKGSRVLRPEPTETDLVALIPRFKIPIRYHRHFKRNVKAKSARSFNNRAS